MLSLCSAGYGFSLVFHEPCKVQISINQGNLLASVCKINNNPPNSLLKDVYANKCQYFMSWLLFENLILNIWKIIQLTECLRLMQNSRSGTTDTPGRLMHTLTHNEPTPDNHPCTHPDMRKVLKCPQTII